MKRKIMIIATILTLGFNFLANVDAMTEEQYYSLNSTKINIPNSISNEGTELDTSEIKADFKLYYQWIEIPTENANKIKKLSYESTEYFIQLLEYGIDIETDFSSSEVNVPDEAKPIKSKSEQTYKEYLSLIPYFDENNWVETTDNKVSYPDNNKSYTLWVKTVADYALTPNQPLYNFKVFVNNTTPAEITEKEMLELYKKYDLFGSNNDNNDDVNENNTTNNNTITANTVQTSENPNTGIEDSVIYLVPLSLILGITFVLSKKYRRA